MRKLYRNVEQKVVLLQNIIDGDEQVDDELHAEIQEECMRHASVKKVVISVQEITMAESEGNPAQLQNTINVFVELASNEDAKKLLNVMSGRYFAGRRISARLYDQELYDQNHLKI
ncbi:MAG: Poly(U)-binding-splicing factor puf60 [Paramarteilia canceri]